MHTIFGIATIGFVAGLIVGCAGLVSWRALGISRAFPTMFTGWAIMLICWLVMILSRSH